MVAKEISKRKRRTITIHDGSLAQRGKRKK
jgi:hypothetical protein